MEPENELNFLILDLLHFLKELDRKGCIPAEDQETFEVLLKKSRYRILQHFTGDDPAV
jgi:hypothetical protein